MRDRLARIIFYASLVVLVLAGVFLWGHESYRSGVWPHGFIENSRDIAYSLHRFHRIVPTNLLHQAPADAANERFAVHRPADMPDGWFVVLGWDGAHGGYAAWLLDASGTTRHTWPIDYSTIDPDGPLNGSDTPYGLLAMPDGSLVVNFDHGDAMARLDACGRPLWVRRGVFHHSLALDDAGDIWTWQGFGTPYGHHHAIVRLDPDSGETLESIDLLADILATGPEAEVALGVRGDYPFRDFDQTPPRSAGADLFHPNDVEVLTAALAPAFPEFAAGDLLVSLRNIDLVAIVDRRDHHLAWWRTGPWIQQHDPDFRADGRISVYDNNTGRGRSEILTVDPRTGEVVNELHDGDVRFYAGTMGKHQILPDGKVLIVAPDEGRVLLVTPHGDRILEINNLVAGLAHVHALVANAIWLPSDYFAAVPACAGP